MSQQYDAFREIDRAEARLQQQMDRRFNDMEKKLDKLERLLEELEKKIEANTEKLENRQYEKSTWTVRQLITILIGFVLGGGALGLIQSIINFLSKGGK